jgi:hypothetical protein
MVEAGFKSVSQFLNDLFASLLSLIKVIIRSRHASQLPERQRPACSVLGNGPSLNQSLTDHFDFIQQTEIVCVNNFAHADVFFQLRPQAYVLLDPGYFVFTGGADQREDIRRTLSVLLEQVNWPMTLYVPHFAKNSYLVQQLQQSQSPVKIQYFNYTVVKGFRRLAFWLISKGFGMPQSQTVIIAALALMVSRRFETVYLFGADASWHEQIRLNDQNQLLMQQLHFYDNNKDVQHLPIIDVRPRQQRTSTMAAQFLSLHKAFKGYETIRDYADYQDVKVLNASAKSYVDAFDRVVVAGALGGHESLVDNGSRNHLTSND